MLEHLYRYAQPSALRNDPEGSRLFLATSEDTAASPLFFQGAFAEPRLSADLLLALARVVHSRFHVPAAMLARIVALSDPVITCAADRLRLEGFSSCCSVYARVDFLPDALDGALLAHGTTNVDFNPEMRAALARIRERETVRLTVGAAEVELSAAAGTVVERKVALPLRWVRGFVEAQALQAAMTPRLQVSGAEARRFLRALPRQGTQGRPAWAAPSGGGLRLSQVSAKGAVRLAGVERLRLLEELARHAHTLRVYAAEGAESSVWELGLPHARFTLALSPEVWRGFSGEGQALSALAGGAGEEETRQVRGALRGQSRLDADTLARDTGLPPEAVRGALARLAAAGVVGFDLADGGYFHRELPFDLAKIEALQPRLRDARRLVAEGGVRIEAAGQGRTEAWVRGSGVEHRVRLTGEGARCSCPWYSKHAGERGPCKHVLAVQITLKGEDDD